MNLSFDGVLTEMVLLFGPGVAIALVGLLLLFAGAVYTAGKNPDLAKRVGSVLVRFFAWASSWFEYKAVEWNIEGHINDYAAKLSMQTPGVDPILIKVQFVTESTIPESFFADGDLIIRLRDSGYKDENLMRAAETYVSEILLPRSKAYMSANQQTALDIFVTDDLLAAENPSAHVLYTTKVLAPAVTRSARIGDLLKQFDLIHYAGYFYPILLQELAFLSEQRVTKSDMNEFRHEVYELLNFFQNLAEREEGVDTRADLEFIGRYSRFCIVIVAKAAKAELGASSPWVNFVKGTAGRFDTVYLIARQRHVPLMTTVAASAESDGMYRVFGSRSYTARIQRDGVWRVRDATVTILRNPHPIAKYLPRHAAPAGVTAAGAPVDG